MLSAGDSFSRQLQDLDCGGLTFLHIRDSNDHQTVGPQRQHTVKRAAVLQLPQVLPLGLTGTQALDRAGNSSDDQLVTDRLLRLDLLTEDSPGMPIALSVVMPRHPLSGRDWPKAAI